MLVSPKMEITRERGLQSASDRRHANSTAALGGESEDQDQDHGSLPMLLVVRDTIDCRDMEWPSHFDLLQVQRRLKYRGLAFVLP